MSDPDRPSAAAWLDSKSPDPTLVVVGVPWDAGSRGDQGPGALRRSLARLSTFHSESEIDLGILPVADAGDWAITGADPDSARSDIERHVRALPPGPMLAFLGGDPAITGPIVNGLGVAEVGLLTVSANHRTGPSGGPPNEESVSRLVEDGLAGNHIAQVGMHGFSNHRRHREFCDAHGLSLFPMDTIDLWGIEETVRVALDQLASTCERIHVSFDAGVLDAAFAPGSPDSRPGGLSSRQLATAALLCGRHPQVGAADFVGIDADLDRHQLTGANLATTFLAFAAGVAARQGVGP